MAVTLEDAKKLTQDKLYLGIIDEFQKDTLLNAMVFDKNVEFSEVSKYNYEFVFRPDAIIPIEIKTETSGK